MLRQPKASSAAAFRVSLWQRADGLGPKVRGQVQQRTSLSASDLEDLWAELLAAAVREPGSPGALPADAELWDDPTLAKWLRVALSRDVIDERRRRVNGAGETWVAGTPLEELAGELERGSIWSSVRPPTPEEAVLGRAAVRQRTEDVRAIVGHDAAQMMLAEASGASGPEQRELLQLSVGRWRTIQGRVEFAAAELRGRTQAVLVWLWPEAWVRWVAGVIGGSASAVLGAGTAAKLAASIALVGGAVAGAAQVAKPERPRSVEPALTASSGTRSPVQSAAPRPAATVAGVVVDGTQRAGSSVRETAAAQKRRLAESRRERLARERRARQRAAAQRRSRQRSAESQDAASEPAVTPLAQASVAASAPVAPTQSGSSAATEFLPDGR